MAWPGVDHLHHWARVLGQGQVVRAHRCRHERGPAELFPWLARGPARTRQGAVAPPSLTRAGLRQVHAQSLASLSAALAERPGKQVPCSSRLHALACLLAHARARAQVGVMLDTKGPEIRTGLLEGGRNIELRRGQLLEISTDYAVRATRKRCPRPSSRALCCRCMATRTASRARTSRCPAA